MSAAELDKLAHQLSVEPAELEFLAGLPVSDVRELRSQISEALFRADRHHFTRMAALAKAVPVAVATKVTVLALPPLLAARTSELFEPKKAVEMVVRLPLDYLADVSAVMDPSRSAEVVAAMPPDIVAAVGAELAERGEWVVMGAFVSYVSLPALRATVQRLSGEELLRIGFVLDDMSRLGEISDTLSTEQLDEMLTRRRRARPLARAGRSARQARRGAGRPARRAVRRRGARAARGDRPGRAGQPRRAASMTVLIEVARNGRVESEHRGRLVLLDASGAVAVSAGPVDEPVLPRSSLKPLQAVALVEHGYPGRDDLLALAAASHDGEDVHVAGARAILAAAGLSEDALQCPPDLPSGRDALLAWVHGGGGARPRVPQLLGQARRDARDLCRCGLADRDVPGSGSSAAAGDPRPARLAVRGGGRRRRGGRVRRAGLRARSHYRSRGRSRRSRRRTARRPSSGTRCGRTRAWSAAPVGR